MFYYVTIPSRPLVQFLVGQSRVQGSQSPGDPVVLSHEDSVQGRQPGVLGGPHVPRHERPVHLGQDRPDVAVQVQRLELPVG